MAANKYQLCPLIDVIENFVIKMAANNSKLAAKKLILVADKSFLAKGKTLFVKNYHFNTSTGL